MPDREQQLADLLSRHEAALEKGEVLAPEDLCRDCPELLPDLRRRLRDLQDMDGLLFGSRPVCGADRSPGVGAIPRVPGYEILDLLGHGGMGVVYKARQQLLNRTVALKLIRTDAQPTPIQRARFQIEAEAVARLQHPNVVQIFDIGEYNGRPFLALEYVEGGSLRDLVGIRRPPPEVVWLVGVLARAVHAAHQRGLLHRDLKPANVLRTADGTLKISDFGLAKFLDAESSPRGATESLTGSGMILGTPAYMAPEQVRGVPKALGPATDVYALGTILYELLTGRVPFRAESTFDLFRLIVERPPPPPRQLRPDLPAELEAICLKCLRKEPGQRYASAQELADDLDRYQRGEPTLARPVGRLERAVKWVKRNPVVGGAVAAVVLALTGGATVSYWKYLDAEQQKGRALYEADKAKKVRDFLVDIFRIAESEYRGETRTARQILAGADKRIRVEFADQPELQAELVAAVEEAKRNLDRTIPAAMILEARGPIRILSAWGANRSALPQVLLFPEDRLTLAGDARMQLVFLRDLHKERLKPGTEVLLARNGCAPAPAVLERDNSVLMTFVRLPKGTFFMGWDDTVKPPRKGVKTEIREDFEVAVHPVTQGQWQAVMGNNPSWFSRTGNGWRSVIDIPDEELKLFPVERVSWDDAQAFLQRLNEQERGRGYLYRLPTEAEWEYACRGGATSEAACSHHFYFDRPTNDLSSELANIDGTTPFGNAATGKYLQRPTRVGAYPPNNLGLCDMHGNVNQWCAEQVFRGGCWANAAGTARAAARGVRPPSFRDDALGFRLARVPVRIVSRAGNGSG